MANALYGAALYGAADYGRISSGLIGAQESQVRETGLKATIIDERVNRWEYVTGVNIDGSLFSPGHNLATQQDYYSYRLQSAAIQKNNGDIVRVRIGNNVDESDRNIYIQTITDPTVTAQWNSWSLLYSGTHYALAVGYKQSDNTIHVLTAKSDGLYLDNSLVWSQTGIISIVIPQNGRQNTLYNFAFCVVVSEDPIDGFGRYRKMELYYANNVAAGSFIFDSMNFRWYNMSIAAIYDENGNFFRVMSLPITDARARNNGDSIIVCQDDLSGFAAGAVPTAPRLIRGLAGEVGHNTLRNLRIFSKLSDGYYYLFYNESHRDGDNEVTETLANSVFWQRSKDLLHWSEPVSAGFSDIGTGLVEHSGYVWFPGYDVVYKRPATSVEYEISNYVPRVNFNIPRDNQEGSGDLDIANPDGINNSLINLSDRRLKLEIGLKTDTGAYEFVQFNDWWIKRVIKNIEGEANRLKVEFGDIWNRLSNKFRDTFNFIGQLNYSDWAAGKRNKAFNYYFASDGAPVESGDTLRTRGIVLYTGWKGINATVSAHFSSVTGNPQIIFRYIDARNYQRIEKQGSTLKWIDKVDGTDTTISSAACAADTSPTISVDFKWGYVSAAVNDDWVIGPFAHQTDPPNVKPGYVGFNTTSYTISDFTLVDHEVPLNAEELIRTALAMGDYHDVITGESSSQELAIIWGPQTDIPTPADGLRQALEATKWDLVWQDQKIRVGTFSNPEIKKIIDNRIIKTDYVDEAARHINLAAVDGNEDTWLEIDPVDTQQRDRQISDYFDLPELTDQDSTKARAIEEIRKGKMGRTPGGDVPLYFDLWRMDAITWIDNAGDSYNVRVEGISAAIEQGMEPSQRETLDTSLLDA